MRQSFFRPSITNLITYLSFGVTVLISIFAYTLLAPISPVVFGNVTIVTPEAVSGTAIKYSFKYCQTAKTAPIVYRQLVPDDPNNIVTFPAVLGVIHPGCHENSVVLPLPTGMQPGSYHLKGTVVYSINSFRSATVTYTSTNTVVIK